MGTLPPWGIEVRRTYWAGWAEGGCVANGDILGGRADGGGPGVTLGVEAGVDRVGGAGTDEDVIDGRRVGCGRGWALGGSGAAAPAATPSGSAVTEPWPFSLAVPLGIVAKVLWDSSCRTGDGLSSGASCIGASGAVVVTSPSIWSWS